MISALIPVDPTQPTEACWLFSEVKLRGINDGEFLSKPATGLPMEVRSGLIEHYDEN